MIDIRNLNNKNKIDEILKYLNRDLSQTEFAVLNYLIDDIYYITEYPIFSHENNIYATCSYNISKSLIEKNKYCYFIFYDIHQKSSLNGFILRGCFIEDKNILRRELRNEKIDKIIENENDK